MEGGGNNSNISASFQYESFLSNWMTTYPKSVNLYLSVERSQIASLLLYASIDFIRQHRFLEQTIPSLSIV